MIKKVVPWLFVAPVALVLSPLLLAFLLYGACVAMLNYSDEGNI